ncbi:hypothetical protein, unlikely [Trypanosoma brucei gambiense DAL972]|uniref:Uncharacterized protein n=1 Tax=Trypanosoma brucei gambiense (strain MHOM/CI/86/DAL972) TaxID=679716 RepID=C9ZIM4_TRYB9|nr:hypothetical protein, unlikely [Trypanosoma brucei gambiense DAL972]CBH09016.1 hypothetical protein, unlikely [Trypanosoma brucei gambiense DAL972]|eukprot:XP_011771457.1 hypothetical protein, unlikely [Trypanosoma brucei gambiense DAL972]
MMRLCLCLVSAATTREGKERHLRRLSHVITTALLPHQ